LRNKIFIESVEKRGFSNENQLNSVKTSSEGETVNWNMDTPHDRQPEINEIYGLLYELGIKADCTGFFYTAYSVYMAALQPERLLLAERWLYPAVASHYQTSREQIERGICAAADGVWNSRRGLLNTIARRTLEQKPGPAGFIAILAAYLSAGMAA
jgi:hypothetical protein